MDKQLLSRHQTSKILPQACLPVGVVSDEDVVSDMVVDACLILCSPLSVDHMKILIQLSTSGFKALCI
jgi:hypothetical protein